MAFTYKITNKCISCGTCSSVCRFNSIKIGFPYKILDSCKKCGKCYEVCPVFAITREEIKKDGTTE